MAQLWQECRAAARSGSGFDLLLAAARLECGCADADRGRGWPDLLEFSQAAARFYLKLGAPPGNARWAAAASSLPPGSTKVQVAAWEGIRFYALDPATYAETARCWLREQPPAVAGAWIVGLRSMGSLLAPVAAAALAAAGCPIRWLTLRPAGPPNDRQIQLDGGLREQWRRWPGAFLIVDEGPGLSGSSFGGMVAALRRLGVVQDRIVLLSSWAPNPAVLGNRYAARHWPAWRVYAAPALAAPRHDALDLSGGLWRQRLRVHTATPVWPQQERRKFLCERGRLVLKFAGFGRFGRATQARAAELARAGWGPALALGASDLERGWIAYRRGRTVPLVRPAGAWCEFAGRYLAWVAATYRMEPHAHPSMPLQEMLSANVEGAGAVELPEGPVCALDGRMLPWEWGQSERGFVKFDGTDHGDDPFFPGPADIAWDLAALAVEFGRPRGQAVLAAYCRASGEAPGALAPRLRWHRLAYLAFRVGFCRLAAAQTRGPDSKRFARQAEAYARLIWDRRA